MKDSRIGESLWNIWEGSLAEFDYPTRTIYYTEDHVDLDNEVVKRALASSLQRDGIALSLSQGFQMIDAGNITQRYIGYQSDDLDLRDIELCDSDGTSVEDVLLVSIRPATFVEVPEF